MCRLGTGDQPLSCVGSMERPVLGSGCIRLANGGQRMALGGGEWDLTWQYCGGGKNYRVRNRSGWCHYWRLGWRSHKGCSKWTIYFTNRYHIRCGGVAKGKSKFACMTPKSRSHGEIIHCERVIMITSNKGNWCGENVQTNIPSGMNQLEMVVIAFQLHNTGRKQCYVIVSRDIYFIYCAI